MQQSAPGVELRLGHVVESFVRWARRVPLEGGLSFPAAAALARVVRDGPQRLTALATTDGLSQPGVTQLVTRLERDGLVRRVPAPDDGRAVLVEATADGAALVGRRREQRAQALRVVLAGLDAADRRSVEAALPALTRLADSALMSTD